MFAYRCEFKNSERVGSRACQCRSDEAQDINKLQTPLTKKKNKKKYKPLVRDSSGIG